jgi:ribosome-associated protein
MPDPLEQERELLGLSDPAHQDRIERRHDNAGGDELTRAFIADACRLLADRHCEDIVAFDVRGMSQLTDFVVVASGTSDRQMKSVGGELAELARERGMTRYGSERDDSSTWIVLDFVDVMVHLFEPVARGHYDLEMLWGDAPRMKWR